MKKAICYQRFSYKDQSQHSIERQSAINKQWCEFNGILVVDSYSDEGYTARNFDRPDIKALLEFIRKNYQGIDYLVVSELTRFSREVDDAIAMVKKIQRDYDVRIVSAGRGSIYDVLDHNSFFMMGIEFLLGNSENIKRQSDVNGGIYAAKVKGKWVQGGKFIPYGYRKEGADKDRKLVINEEEAVIIRYLYEAARCGTPDYIMRQRAKELGFNRTGNSAVRDILLNPVYAGYQNVRPYKELPGGLYKGEWEPIIDMVTWQAVQDLLTREEKGHRLTIDANIPLRGVVKCHCGQHLTGAPSRGRHGKYYYYYKCQAPGHNNWSATDAHKKLQEILKHMSLPERLVAAIRSKSEQVFEEREKDNQLQLQTRRRELENLERQMRSVEEKFINNHMGAEAYQRWVNDISARRLSTKTAIDKLTKDQEQVHFLVQQNLDSLTDLQGIWNQADPLQQQALIKMGFDNRLYVKDRVYRTPYIMPIFAHNLLILNQKQLLVFDGTGGESGQVHLTGLLSNRFADLLALVHSIRVA
ncbi:MAG: recombinase family protein [Sphingobacteriales bacterium]|nr:MAG: recombinase family protein [Sphingobacteriales bacterium]